MKHYLTNEIKNIVLVGSSKSGKTTLAECMMFEGGVIKRMGSVDDGNTISDYHELERERGSSVFSSIMHTEWRGTKINIIDTPGLDDFIGELIPSLRIADTALLSLNSQYGVEVGTEIIWRYLEKYNKPTVIVVNQIDHSKADFNTTIEKAKERFGPVVQMQYPYNPGEGFDAIIDVLKMVMYKFPEGGGKPEKLPIPAEEKEKADELHNTLVEAAAENDDDLMELYFEEGELNEDQMRQGIRIGMLNRTLFPVFCVSAKQNMGSGRLMGFLGNVAPSASDTAPEVDKEGNEIKVSDPETTLLIFKASSDKHTGAMSFFKVCSGELNAGMELVTTNTRTKNKMNQLYIVDGKNKISVDKLSAGDIGASVKLKDTYVNHTMRPTDDGVEVAPIVFPEPKIRTAIAPENDKEDEKLGLAINKIRETDPTLLSGYRRELKQTIMQGQGDLHLRMTKWQLENIHGVKVKFDKPRISYRETITANSEGYYKHKKQSGGSGQYGEVYMKIQPYTEYETPPSELKVRDTQEIEMEWGGKLVFNNCIVGGVIDTRFMPAILKGIMEVMETGPITGSYCRDVSVYIYDGKMHAVDSNEISFKIAGAQAFKEAFLNAKPKLLEPMLKVEVLAPSDFTGDIMTDLTQRRAIPQGIDSEGNFQKIIAHVPLAEMYQYATTLSSITQGRATHSREFLAYSTVPGDIQNKLAAESKKEKETV